MLASFPNCAVHNARSTTIYDATVKKNNAPFRLQVTSAKVKIVVVCDKIYHWYVPNNDS